MKNHKRLLVSQCKYTKTPMSKFECFGHAVKGQCYRGKLGFLWPQQPFSASVPN